MLGSFPDLADVIEIVLESKAQHEETWEGQVDLTLHNHIGANNNHIGAHNNHIGTNNIHIGAHNNIITLCFVLYIALKAPSKRALPLLAIVLAKQQVKIIK